RADGDDVAVADARRVAEGAAAGFRGRNRRDEQRTGLVDARKALGLHGKIGRHGEQSGQTTPTRKHDRLLPMRSVSVPSVWRPSRISCPAPDNPYRSGP